MRAAVACLLACSVLVAMARADRHGGDERVEELMERTHEGRRSPYGQLRRILAGEAADWAVVERAVAGFEPMCRALVESPVADIKDSADGYVDAVKDLRAAAGRRDEGAVREAFQGLSDSCGDCHFKGGVGGALGHEHHEGKHAAVDSRGETEEETEHEEEEEREEESEDESDEMDEDAGESDGEAEDD